MSVLVFLGIGTAAMLALGILRRRQYSLSLWKTAAITILLTAAGVLGTRLLFFVENGGWDGLSYFGAVFLIPVLFLPLAFLLRLPYGKLMDFVVPAECAMLAVMKIDCLLTGCCGGKVLFYTAEAKAVYFPSQLVECLNAVLLMLVLLWLERYPRLQNRIYPWYLILYGGTRFLWNFFRWGLTPFVWILPAGHFWALCSMALGAVALACLFLAGKRKGRGRRTDEPVR